MVRPALRIETVPEDQVSDDLDRLIGLHLYECFAWRQRANDYSRTWYGQKPDSTVLGFIGDRLVAHTAVVRRRYLQKTDCPNGLFPTDPAIFQRAFVGAGIQGVSVKEAYRKRHYGIEILNAAMDEARRLGFDIAILHAPGYLEQFYAKLGWKWDDRIAFILDVNDQSAKTQPGNMCMTAVLR